MSCSSRPSRHWTGPSHNPHIRSISSLPWTTKAQWIGIAWGLCAPCLGLLYVLVKALELISYVIYKPCAWATKQEDRRPLLNEMDPTVPKCVTPRKFIHIGRNQRETYGTWLADVIVYGTPQNPFVEWETPLERVIVVIPGNPGNIHFYHEYMSALAYNLRGVERTLVMGIGHSHCSKTCVNLDSVEKKARQTEHTLESQIRHKLAVLEQIRSVHKGVQFITIGHSVGSYISLRLADTLGADVIIKQICLFPTVSHIGSTPNGIKLYPLFCYARPLVGLLARIIGTIPNKLQERFACSFVGSHPHCVFGLKSIIDPIVAKNCLVMAKHEMEEIRDMPTEIIEKFKDKIIWYFAEVDQWNREGDYEEIRQIADPRNVHLCERGYKHAFVNSYEASLVLANDTVSWVENDIRLGNQEYTPPCRRMIDNVDWETHTRNAEVVES